MRHSQTLRSNQSAAAPSWRALTESPAPKAADAYRAAPAPLTPFKQSQHFVIQRRVEIVGDLDFAFQQTEVLFPDGSGDRAQPCHRLAGLGDDDFGTGRDLIDQSREVSLRLVDIHRMRHRRLPG